MEFFEKALSMDPYFVDAKLYQAHMYNYTDREKALDPI